MRLLATQSRRDVAFFDHLHPMVSANHLSLPPADAQTGRPTAAVLQLRELHPGLPLTREGVRLMPVDVDFAHVVCGYAVAALDALFYFISDVEAGSRVWFIVDRALTADEVARERPLPENFAAMASEGVLGP